MKILSNQIECLHCGDRPYSAHRHDFKFCKCEKCAVDGGMDYLRRLGWLGKDYKDLSISVPDDVFDAVMEKLEWCDETGRNNLGRFCAVMIALRDSGYLDEFRGS